MGRPARVGVHAEDVVRRAGVVVVDLVGALRRPSAPATWPRWPGGRTALPCPPGYRWRPSPSEGSARFSGAGARWSMVEGPTCSSSQSHSGRAARRTSTTRLLAAAVPSQAATGHCFMATRPLLRSRLDPGVVLGVALRRRLQGIGAMDVDLGLARGRRSARSSCGPGGARRRPRAGTAPAGRAPGGTCRRRPSGRLRTAGRSRTPMPAAMVVL